MSLAGLKPLKKLLSQDKWVIYIRPDESLLISERSTIMIKLPSQEAIELKGRTVSAIVNKEETDKKFDLWDNILGYNAGKHPVRNTDIIIDTGDECNNVCILHDLGKKELFPVNRYLYSVMNCVVSPGTYRTDTGLLMGVDHVDQVICIVAGNMTGGWEETIKNACKILQEGKE